MVTPWKSFRIGYRQIHYKFFVLRSGFIPASIPRPIHWLGLQIKPKPFLPYPEKTSELQTIPYMLTAEKNRLQTADQEVREYIQSIIKTLKNQLAELEKEIEQWMKNTPEYLT